jgi:hypothetical protein
MDTDDLIFQMIAGRRRHREAVGVQAHPATTAEIGGTKKAPSEAARGREVEDIGPMNAALLAGADGLPAVIDIVGSFRDFVWRFQVQELFSRIFWR